ncbi:shikimate dehydrogenase [Pontibacter sp. SGAir0037]|uniref:shikimate dehydrogenase family protein n=1 Tax=Pontibacter sp. SGAir0037 TaxID=2571030 RepID=UPI0010CD278A|nr:shikimate dehydrogenase [Pontibacter sp. SGAir0037]QCR23631.1 shikimate dehydrogenase [Pontibacter sp. SGAir0037]
MRRFGLIGKKLGHSFSKKYFSEKFLKEGIQDAAYELYELPDIERLKALLEQEEGLVGLNVTVPYKEEVLPLLDELDEAAAAIGAVNTIKISEGKLKGYNTDYIGFRKELEEFYPEQQRGQALVLGTGGAAKAVKAALTDLQIPYMSVSRKPNADELSYQQLQPATLAQFNLIVNTTPLGMYPNTDELPRLPYNSLSSNHFLYDLVYNPELTAFMQKGMAAGAKTINGLGMLYGQAEAAWNIWNT